MKKTVLLVTVIAAAGLLSCASLVGGGSGTDVPDARMSGLIVDTEDNPVHGALVSIIPQKYNPVTDAVLPDSCTTVTDASGLYVFNVTTGASYTILAVRPSSHARALIFNVKALSGMTVVPKDTVRDPGAILVAIPAGADTVNGYFFVPGTKISALIKGNQSFVTLDSVPQGLIPSLHYGVRGVAGTQVVKDSIVVPAGGIVTVPYPGWSNSRKLYLNTTAAAANVSGNVTGFPVLVRLTAINFDFLQAKPDGSDLRFSKSDGTPLAFEIERWDAAAKAGEIWVRADTVYGSNGTQYFVMYWGNASAASASNGVAVFDTANGFVSDWHLDKSCNDATGNRNNGVNYGTSDTLGIIGYAKKFNGADSIKIAGLLGTPSSVTLSVWVLVDSAAVPSGGAEVVSIGDAVLLRVNEDKHGTMGAFHVDSIVDTSGAPDFMHRQIGSKMLLGGSAWHFIAFTIDAANTTQVLFIDGVANASSNYTNQIYYSGVGSNTLIGAHGNGKSFTYTGGIDEVCASRVARSADWIKLCYTNQNADNTLVEFRQLLE
jgi:hypothetical protein